MSSVCPVHTVDSGGSGTRYRDLSSFHAGQTASHPRSETEGHSWICCPDSNEHTTTLRGGQITAKASSSSNEMKAAGRQVSAAATAAEKLNGETTKRRPSYPGELRAKHTNMATKIWVKVAMAIVYFLCVSVAAFVLVIYYVFFWTPDAQYNITSTEAPNRTECTRVG